MSLLSFSATEQSNDVFEVKDWVKRHIYNQHGLSVFTSISVLSGKSNVMS